MTPGPKARARTRRARVGLAGATMAVLVLAGCSSGGGSSSSSGTSGPSSSKDPVCVAEKKLEKTVVGLTRPGVLTGGRSGVNAAADDVKQSLTELRDAADSSLKPDVDALTESVDQLRAAAGNFGKGGLADSLRQTSAAIRSVSESAQSLVTALKDKCPLPG